MSIKQISALFYRSGLDLNELAVALALADFADDDGGNVRPAMRTLARKVNSSRANVQRILRRLEAIGYVEVIGNPTGGAATATRRLRLHPEVFDNPTEPDLPTGRKSATGRRPDTRRRAAQDPSQLCTQPVADLRPNPSLPVMEPSGGRGSRAPDPNRSPTGSRLPPDFPNAEAMLWARQEAPEVDARLEEAKFRDYWSAAAGSKARKADWAATWRNWIRRARDDGRKAAQRAIAHQTRRDKTASAVAALTGRGQHEPRRLDGGSDFIDV